MEWIASTTPDRTASVSFDSDGQLAVLDESVLTSFDATGMRRWQLHGVDNQDDALAVTKSGDVIIATSIGIQGFARDGSELVSANWPLPHIQMLEATADGGVAALGLSTVGNEPDASYLAVLAP